MNWPEDAVIALDGENIDGENNGLVSTGEDAYSWANTGSYATPFVRSAVPSTPLIKKRNGSSVVSFDGRSDILTCAGSAAALSFIHSTGVFDIALVMRRNATRTPSGVRLFGTEGKGLGVFQTGYIANTTVEGGFEFILNNGVGVMADLVTQGIAAPIGTVVGLFLRGDGSKLSATMDFWNFESTALINPIAGNAAHDYGLGSTGGNPGSGGDFSCVDLFDFRVWPRNLSKPETDLVLANFNARKAAA